jgi:HlyD family secretion protein
VIFLFILIAVTGAFFYWYLTTQRAEPASAQLAGSGTVEATRLTIAPEMAGRVMQVLVNEGDHVKAGDVLIILDSTLLSAQRNQAQQALNAAQAGLKVAQDGYQAAVAGREIAATQVDLALAQALLQVQQARSAAWGQGQPDQFDQPNWYYTHSEQLSAALDELNSSKQALEDEQASFRQLKASANYANLASVEDRLARARVAWVNSQDVLNRALQGSEQSLTQAAQDAFDAANNELDSAQAAYADLLSTQQAADILDARARLATAQERFDTAQDRYNSLLSGRDALQVRVANATLDQAQANVTLAQSKLDQAHVAIDQAQAALDLITVQVQKLTLTAPVAGVILSRSIEPGEVIQPGASALTLADLAHLTITVYLPENRYGEVKLGDTARVKVDSFPGMNFSASVTRISDQAEFTPRNVQTVEGRSSTVYAVQLAVEDPQGLLKPGMPADVSFTQP